MMLRVLKFQVLEIGFAKEMENETHLKKMIRWL